MKRSSSYRVYGDHVPSFHAFEDSQALRSNCWYRRCCIIALSLFPRQYTCCMEKVEDLTLALTITRGPRQRSTYSPLTVDSQTTTFWVFFDQFQLVRGVLKTFLTQLRLVNGLMCGKFSLTWFLYSDTREVFVGDGPSYLQIAGPTPKWSGKRRDELLGKQGSAA